MNGTMSDTDTAPELIDRKLKIGLAVFLVISLIMLGFIARDVWEGDIGILLALIGVLLGTLVGVILGRLLNIRWRADKARVVSELDVVGVLAIIAYIALDLSRTWIFGHFIQGPALGAFTLALLAGALFGRFIGMRISITRVLASRRV
jgi:hypothetical protein